MVYDVDKVLNFLNDVKKRFPKIVGPKKEDICYATTNRQDAVKKIASKCDRVIIIGAYNSSNSLRLVEVAKNSGCKKSLLIQNNKDFKWDQIINNENIGLSASASAPEDLILNFIEECKRRYIVNIIQDNSIKEDVVFNIPSNLKRVS